MALLKRWSIIIVVFIVIYFSVGYTLSLFYKPTPHPLKGKKAPDITVKKLDGTEINLNSLSGKSLIVIDFWATWCGPCTRALPALEKLAQKYKNEIVFAKVNVDENPDIASEFGIMSIPTFIIFKNGEVVGNIIGAMPEEILERKILEFLK